MLGIFNTFKIWAMTVGAAVVAVFIAMYKYRGNKIDSLETAIKVAKHNAEVKEHVDNQENKVSEFETANKVAAAKATRDVDVIEHTFYDI